MDDFSQMGQSTPEPSAGETSVGQATPEPTSTLDQIVDVGGREMKVGDLIKSYGESRNALDTKFTESDKQAKQITEMQTKADSLAWAEEFTRRYNGEPDFREHQDSFFRDSPGASTPTPQSEASQEIAQVRREFTEFQTKQMRTEWGSQLKGLEDSGYPMSDEHKTNVMRHLVNTGESDAGNAYRNLYFDDILKQEREKAVVAAHETANTNASYPQASKGSASPSKKPSELSGSERDTALNDAFSKVLG